MSSIKYAANISILFPELPLLERAGAAATAGLAAVESWWPFAAPTPDASEIDAYVGAIESAGVSLIALNFYAGDMPAGERGVVCDPDRVDEFRASVDVLTDIAHRTGCRQFNALYGQQGDRTTAIENLRYAANQIDGVVLLEALTAGENGDYPLRTAADVQRLIDELDADNVRLLLDTYHLTNNGDDIVSVASTHKVGHVQVADSPGRHQPGTGAIDFGNFFTALREHGYDGYVGCEYKPLGPTEESLGWLKEEWA